MADPHLVEALPALRRLAAPFLEHPKSAPTVLDVLGPEYAAKHTAAVHIDDTVMEDDRFDEAEEIRRDGERLRQAG